MEVGHKVYQILCVPVPELELGLHNGSGTQSIGGYQAHIVPVPGRLGFSVRVTQDWNAISVEGYTIGLLQLRTARRISFCNPLLHRSVESLDHLLF